MHCALLFPILFLFIFYRCTNLNFMIHQWAMSLKLENTDCPRLFHYFTPVLEIKKLKRNQ